MELSVFSVYQILIILAFAIIGFGLKYGGNTSGDQILSKTLLLTPIFMIFGLCLSGFKALPAIILFSLLIGDSRIFTNKAVFRSTYIPERLPHREEQIKGLTSILSAALEGEKPQNIVIYGETGTGKTTTVKFVCNTLGDLARKTGITYSTVYIDCEVLDTQYRVFGYLARAFDKDIPITGWPTDKVYAEFKNGIDSEKRDIIVILDGVDELVSKGDEVLYQLSRINDEITNARISVIGISNDLTFSALLDSELKSSLDAAEILFPPYTAEQLQDILYERAEQAFHEASLDDAVIPLCAAFATSMRGNARCALDLLCASGEIAEQSGSKKVYEEHVRHARERIETNRVIEVVKTLPLQAKIVLSSVIRLSRGRNKRRVYSGDVYNMYRRLCAYEGVDALTQRRITDFISELDILELVNAVIVNKGRYGRTRQISLSVPEECVGQILLEDDKIKALSALRVRTQITTQERVEGLF